MKTIKKRGLLCLVLFIGLQCLKIGLIESLPQVYTEGRIEIYPKEKLEVTSFCESDSYKKLQPVVLNEQSVTLKVKKERELVGRGTTSNLPMMEPIQIVDGAFWGAAADREGRNVILLSDEVAKQYFGSIQVTGNVCEIEGMVYQIVGVYRKYKYFWDYWFDLGEDVIYFPATSTLGKKAPIKAVILPSQVAGEIIEEKALLTLGLTEENSEILHGEDVKASLRSLKVAATSVAGVILILYCFMESYRCLLHLHLNVRQKGIHIVSYLILILITQFFFLRGVYLPSEALPPYNLFDISYYIKHFKEQLVTYHRFMRISLTLFEPIYWQIKQGAKLINLLQIILSFPMCKWLVFQVNSLPNTISKLALVLSKSKIS